MATITQEIKVDVAGKLCPKFKAGAELSGKVNAIYFDTNVGAQDGKEYEYSIQFSIIDPGTTV